MRFFIPFAKRQKRKPGSLVKEISLSQKEVAYRLALEKYHYRPQDIPLSEWYESLKAVKAVRDRYFMWIIFCYSLLVLVYLGAIKSISAYGVSLDNGLFLAVSLMSTSFAGLMYTNYQNKIYKYDSVFSYIFDKSEHCDRQDLLLRYPDAYTVMQFSPFLVSNPKHMYWKRDFPIRLILLLIALSVVLLVYVVLALALLYNVSIELWNNSSAPLTIINRSILIATYALYIVSILLHTSNTGKIRYEHYGLSTLLAKLQLKDPTRYKLRVSQIIK